MSIARRLRFSVLTLGLLAAPGFGRLAAQEHRRQDLENLPSPMEAVRGVQNAGRMAFMMADVDHDGQISQQEAIDAANLMVGGFFFRADADGNGVVTEQEANSGTDRYLDQNPWVRYVLQSLQAQANRKAAQTGSQPPAGQGLGVMVLLDSNGDKQIQAAELRQLVQTFTQSVFAAADINRDGKMNPSEINAAVAGATRSVARQMFQQAD